MRISDHPSLRAIGALAAAVALLTGSTALAKRWTGPMPVVPGTDHSDTGVFHTDHTRYVIPREACENYRKYQLCWMPASDAGDRNAQRRCDDQFPWQTSSMNWNTQIANECHVDPAALSKARRDAVLASRAAHAAAQANRPKAAPLAPIRTYLCDVPTSDGHKRRTAWVRSVEEARAKAYESYAPIATVKQSDIDCKLK